MSENLENEVLSFLNENGATKAKDIAAGLKVDKKDVNALLYGRLKRVVSQNNSYEWSLKDNNQKNTTAANEVFSNSAISRLTRYYLACLGSDEAGVSTFAASRYGEPDYVELQCLPESANDFLEMAEARMIAGRIRKDRSRLGVYFGYPTVLGLLKSKKSNWQGYMIEPIFLFPMQETGNGQLMPDFSFPIVNHKCLRRFTNTSANELMEQVVQLEEELGLSDVEATPDLDELALRLRAIREEWPWIEEPSSGELPNDPPLSQADREGVYNRAVLVISERSPFTKGLENELAQLGKLSEGALSRTALGEWIKGEVAESDEHIGTDELLEVLPMNTEQRQAVAAALSQSLTVITGPPGTGKSQVVTNLLVNAAWRGQKVLFASKNNKAVDVVEARVNGLGPRPVLLRIGSNEYQNKLAEYLMALLSATASPEDKSQHEECLERHSALIGKHEALQRQAEELLSTRNSLDAIEQQIDSLRDVFKAEFKALKVADLDAIALAVHAFARATDSALVEKQNLVTRLLWRWQREQRFERLLAVVQHTRNEVAVLGLRLPGNVPTTGTIEGWQKFRLGVEGRLEQAMQIRAYFALMAKLQSMPSLEEISRNQADVIADMASNAEKLWESWLRLQPDRLRREDRQLLNKYSSTLKMMLDGAGDDASGKKIATQHRSLLSKVNHLLSCWAVTSLSAKGKLPFEPGYFDLVVFDESSQCDIASALPLLYRAKRVAVIGDPKQLSHISGLRRGQDHQLLDKFNLAESCPHWAYSYNSLFDLAAGLASSEDIVNLRDHHRCHSDIIEFSNKEFYEGRLRVATRHNLLKSPRPDGPGINWVNVKGRTVRPVAGGAENEREAAAVVTVLRRLVFEREYAGTVGVVSPFRAQANLVRRLVNEDKELFERLMHSDFLVDTVHKFQGDERDVMLFSPVVSAEVPRGALGFLANNGNLFNVAITRARGQLIVVGDSQACAACEVPYLANFAKYSSELESRIQREVELAVQDLGPRYPQVANPEQVSDWERLFYEALYEAGIRAIPQYRVERYALDFALFDDKRRLDIEVDGERYHRNWTGELCRRDQMRNQRLFELGWDVQRFWVYEVHDDLETCIERVWKWLRRGAIRAV